MPKFNENLRTQSYEGEEYQGIRTAKTFEFENKSHVKKMPQSLRKVSNNMYDQSNMQIRGIYQQKLSLILAL